MWYQMVLVISNLSCSINEHHFPEEVQCTVYRFLEMRNTSLSFEVCLFVVSSKRLANVDQLSKVSA